MDPSLWSFLTKFRDHTDSYNFTSQCAPNVGKFKIERGYLEDFWKIYCDAVYTNPNLICGVSEKPNEFLPILVDMDLEIKYDPDIDLEQKLYTLDEVKVIMSVYQKVIKEISKDRKTRDCVCLLLEKSSPYKSGERIKGGFHLHFPRLWIRNCDHDLHIYPRVVKYLNDEYPNLFSRLKEPNTGDLVDKKVCNKHWLLYGGSKSETSKSYKFTQAFDHQGNEITLKDVMDDYKLFDTSETEIKIDNDSYQYYLPRILSIHPSERRPIRMKVNLECISKATMSTAQERTNFHESIDYNEAVALAQDLMPMISPWRADAYDDWLEMLFVLYCIGDGCQEVLDLAIAFSARTSNNNFDEAYCVHQWQKITNTHKYSIGTLRYYAGQDSPKEYEQWKKKQASSRIKDSLQGGHNDLAKMLHDCYGGVFVCASLKEKAWFEYKNHKWKQIEHGITLKQKISVELVDRFRDEARKVFSNLSDEGGCPDGENGPPKAVKLINTIIKNLKSAPFKSHVMTEASEVFYNDDFLERLDSDPNLIGFTNGVFDVKTMVFRNGKPEDYISLSTGYDYKNYNEDDAEVLEVKDFLIKVFPDPILRRYFLEYAAQLLKGGNMRKTFLCMSGDGDNAKSVTIELVEQSLGKYAVKLPTTLITGKRTQSSQACPELARTHGVRFAVLQEPNNKDVINLGILKELTGNDSFYARNLFKEGKEIKPMFKLALICNVLPSLPCDDPASWNRIRVLMYESRFPKNTEEVPKTFEEQMIKKVFNRDSNFNEKLPQMKQAFMWMLIQVYKEISINGLTEEPEKVKEATAIYRRNNDVFLQFVSEVIMTDNEASLSLSEAYSAFQQWFRDSLPNVKIPIKNDLREDLLRRWGPASESMRWPGVRIRTVRDDIKESKALVLSSDDLAGDSDSDEEEEEEKQEHSRLLKKKGNN
jgi:P4 family phage/plasmid primase-like protien